MKSRKFIIPLVVFAVILLIIYIVFTTDIGSSVKRTADKTIDNIKAAYGEIADFFEDTERDTGEKWLAAPLETRGQSAPMLITDPHTELIPSPYNSISSTYTLTSLCEAEVFEQGTDAVSDAAKNGYTVVPQFADLSVNSVTSILKARGIPFNTVSASNPAPQGSVFAIRYAGLSDSNGYYINPVNGVTLFVSAAKKTTSATSGDNLVYLTFDDGPSAAHTEEILNILDTYGISGAFFTVGTAVEKNPELVKLMLARGHAVGCHTMTHVYTDIYASVQSLENEIISWEQLLSDNGIELDENSRIFRFPGGSVGNYFDSWARDRMLEMLESHSYRVYDWNVSINDAVLFLADEDETTYEYIKKSFTDSLEIAVKQNKGKADAPIIVLMHESAHETPELLKWIIEYFIDKGYSFGSLSNIKESFTFGN